MKIRKGLWYLCKHSFGPFKKGYWYYSPLDNHLKLNDIQPYHVAYFHQKNFDGGEEWRFITNK
jgi:hypothetical protein